MCIQVALGTSAGKIGKKEGMAMKKSKLGALRH
jgi:hypothetical protein